MILETIISATSSLGALVASVVLLMAFWRLQLFSPSVAARIGSTASLILLLIWAFYGLLWMVSMLPGDIFMKAQIIYSVPYLFTAAWILSSLALFTALLTMAWVIHHGINMPPTPSDP